jgi:hypothetical protein
MHEFRTESALPHPILEPKATNMNTPSARTRRITAYSAGPVAILLAGALVWSGSQAAFTATTRNAGNAWSTGSLALTDDDRGVAGFTVESMVPGDSGEQCIVITSGSDVAGEVRVYAENINSTRGLENYIFFDVERGTGGSFGDCTGFVSAENDVPALPLSALRTANYDYATGGSPWTTTGTPGEQTTYRGTWRFDTTGLSQQQVDALQGGSVSMDMVWELQSGDTPTQS